PLSIEYILNDFACLVVGAHQNADLPWAINIRGYPSDEGIRQSRQGFFLHGTGAMVIVFNVNEIHLYRASFFMQGWRQLLVAISICTGDSVVVAGKLPPTFIVFLTQFGQDTVVKPVLQPLRGTLEDLVIESYDMLMAAIVYFQCLILDKR